MALAGYNEVLTLTLLSRNENRLFSDELDINSLDLKEKSLYEVPEYSNYVYDLTKFNNIFLNEVHFNSPVVLSNPKSKEYEVVRTSLLPGILKSVSSNLHGKVPIKMFEVADVVLKRNEYYNIKKACGVICSTRSLLEDLQGPLSFVLEKCGFKNFKYLSHNSYPKNFANVIYLENQSAYVLVDDIIVGSIGVLHPKVSQNFDIPYATSAFEIDIQLIYNLYSKNK